MSSTVAHKKPNHIRTLVLDILAHAIKVAQETDNAETAEARRVMCDHAKEFEVLLKTHWTEEREENAIAKEKVEWEKTKSQVLVLLGMTPARAKDG